MKKLLFLFALFGLLSYVCYPQNLVPNPSFEDYIQCPNALGQIEFANGWINFGISPDYFNTCAYNNLASVPSNAAGYQNPSSGNAYAGLFTKQLPTINVREYIGVNLMDTLILGIEYYVSFRVSLGYGGTGGINCATNNLGALFTTYQFYYTGMYPAITKNHAHIYETEIITDTANWTTISGSFIADSAYQYLVIGNFFDDTLTSHIKYFDNGYSECASYYYIDDIYVGIDTTVNTEIQDLEKTIKVYPNPAIDNINVYIPEQKYAYIKVYDLFGKMIFEKETTDENNSISLYNQQAGIYLIKIKTEKQISIKKIILTQ